MSAVRLDATVRGVVQGVGFRMFVVEKARGTGLTGWVANERSGEVHCVAEGERATLERLLADLERGPAGAMIARVEAVWMPATGTLPVFSIRSGGHSGD